MMALKICKESIDTYCDIMTKNFEKSVVIRGHSGSGKTFCMLYIDLYSIPKGFYLTSTENMCHN